VTDFGKIYRGALQDGAFTLWAFGSTSAFDNALNIDTQFFADPNHLPIAAFKFQNLSLTGNPTIDLSNGGVTKLALVAVDGITSGPPGGVLTFTALDLVALATVDGSINLSSDVSFQNLNELAMYARGAGSDLTLNSPISNIGALYLAAEGSIQLTNPGTMSVGGFQATAGNNLALQIGGSLSLDGKVRLNTLVLPGTTVANGANLTLNVTGDYTNNSATDDSQLDVRNEGAHIGTGGNIGVSIGGNLTAMNDFNLVVQNMNGQIDNGGNITLVVGGNVSLSGALNATLDNTGGLIGSDTSLTIVSLGALTAQGDATFQILNSDNGVGGSPGQIGGNATIGVSSAGDFNAGSLTAFINDRHGGSIGSSALLAFNVAGALSVANDASLGISTRNDGTGGGTIGADTTVGLTAGSISVGGAFTTFVSTNGGGSITGNAINLVGATGDMVVQGPIDVTIGDTGFNQLNPPNFIAGGHIGGDATLTLAAQNITTSSTATGVPGTDVMALEASIYTNGQGTIGGNAIVNVDASQNISAPGTVFFTVANGNYQNFGPGTIGGDAQINVSAANLSTGALFDDIYNYGGASIGGDAIISLNLSNSFTATGDAEFLISSSGGTITRDASINVTAGDISAPSMTANIDNSNAGTINGSADVSFNLTGDLTTQGDATFTINNSNGGTIGGNATIDVTATNITANSLTAQIDNTGGSIGASTEGGATINMNVSGSATVTSDATVQILGSDGAVGGAAININGGTYNAGGTFLSYIDGNGTITFNNATAHADVLKAGVFGANGVLNVGGGILSADSELKLYAPGSNGQLNFVSNVTLGGNTSAILAANSVTIFNNVVVTIASNSPAEVYTNNANYTGFGGNGTTTGTFAGAGANNPQPLANAPPFNPIAAPAHPHITRTNSDTINVSNTAQLLALLDNAKVGPDGKVTVSASQNTRDLRNSNRMNSNDLPRGERRMLMQQVRDRSIAPVGGRRTL
jgi:hypothetical protein